MSPGAALGVDFGTSHTVAVVRWPDGRARPLLVDGSPLLPSAVYAPPGADAPLVAGRDAVHSARLDPARFEPNPKRRVDDGSVLLGERDVPVADLVSAVLGRLAEEWRRTIGDLTTGEVTAETPPALTLTCPATWGATRRALLSRAAADAGLGDGRLVAEPVAAATYFAEVLGRDVPIGSAVVVHDFGAGTFDASVVVRRSTGFEVLAVDGRADLGGLDVDAALVEHLAATYAPTHPEAWERLRNPATVEDRRAKRQLWDDVRVAKERLSRSPSADLVVPICDVEAHLTRTELEKVALPILAQTVQVTKAVIDAAALPPGNRAGVFLVGGSSRIPLLATLLHRELGEPPVVIEQPELVVAEGAVLSATALLASAPGAVPVTGQFPKIVEPANGAIPPPTAVAPISPAPNGAATPSTAEAPAGIRPTSSPPAPGTNQPASAAQDPGAVQAAAAAREAATPGGPSAASPTPPGSAAVAHSTAQAAANPAPAGSAAVARGAAAVANAPTRNGHAPKREPTTDPLPEPAPAFPPGRAAVPVKPAKPAQRPSRFGRDTLAEPALVADIRALSGHDEPRVYREPAPQRPRDDRPPVWDTPRPTRGRSGSGFGRFLRRLIMFLLLMATPIVSAVVAFHYATGDSYTDIIEGIRRWLSELR
ncbi:Hsp70 family protein [Asanoa sp. WMMD1127]|uniref:Hsp70 family protein n=1 Tax=Asanoa sp. WMMD1127 TaxID=3016107 RepID=UPI002416D348|nr:Hsp70 family protein [Asanoa sp. WMMD1127]MDG4823425.1 Hsp70 family protein [Asanoa sp. WMMD1127]